MRKDVGPVPRTGLKKTVGKPFKKRKPLRLENYDYTGSAAVYFITMCTAEREPHFLNKGAARIVADELDYRMKAGEIHLFCYCIMPDHLHMLLSLTEQYGKSLQNWVAAFKRYVSREANELFGIKPLWQKNFHEHIVRREESLLEITRYILNIPVRKGMVTEWSEYPLCRMSDELPLR